MIWGIVSSVVGPQAPVMFLLITCVTLYLITYSSPMLEKAMATDSSTLVWKIPWMEKPGRLQSMGSLRVNTTEQLHFHFSLSCIGQMATNSSVLAWRVPGVGEPGGLPSMGLHRVGHDWIDLAAAAASPMLDPKCCGTVHLLITVVFSADRKH